MNAWLLRVAGYLSLPSIAQGVMEFLEEKRGNFPRFYFLSNNEMVNVLVR
jgi:hypothetical protein